MTEKKIKKVFLTGASGKLGSYLYYVLKKHFKILALGNKSEIGYVQKLNLLNNSILIKKLNNFNPDVIVHLAAISNVDLCEKNMNLAKELLHMTSHELTLAQDRMGVLGKMNANERVAKFIINISEQRARIGWQSNPVSLPMTRQDIADYLGLTLETVSREITRFKTSNLIKLMNTKQIFIVDKIKLTAVCN